jgi:hypothetical protein
MMDFYIGEEDILPARPTTVALRDYLNNSFVKPGAALPW